MNSIRMVFMGTPEFAVPVLRELLRLKVLDGQSAELVAVFTQPDRPAGRGNRLTPPPVKEIAAAAGIPVAQPERLRRPESFALLEGFQPDLIVVAAYAQILSPKVLALPRYGCINVHASLLPAYRGAAPIQAAILAGDAETGVSIMQMEAGLDTGPVLSSYREPIRADDTTGSLSARLAAGGAALLVKTLPGWIAGTCTPVIQDEAQATLTRPLKKGDGAIDWTRPGAAIERQVRAMYPWPGAFTLFKGQPLKITQARTVSHQAVKATPGTLLAYQSAPIVATGADFLELLTVQPAGKRPMAGAAWLRGAPDVVGVQLS